MLLSWANVHFYQDLMARARAAIGRGAFSGLAHDVQRRYSARNDGDEATEATEATDADA